MQQRNGVDPQGPLELDPGRRQTLKRRSPLPLVVLALLLIAGAIAGYLLHSKPAPEPPSPPPAAAPTPPTAEAPAPRAVEPLTPAARVDAEALLRREAGKLSSAPELQGWLAQPNLIERLAAAVNLVAQGESPRPVLGFLAPAAEFSVIERDGATFAAPQSFARYDTFTRIVTAIDARAAASAYGVLAPALRSAFAGIAKPGTTFDATLRRALQVLRTAPVPQSEPALKEKGLRYAYVDPALEALSSAQKQLLRLGPANARALQTWLGAFEAALPAP